MGQVNAEGSGGTPDPDSPEAEDFVSGGSVDWRGLAGAVVGSLIGLVSIIYVESIGLLSSAILGVMSLFSGGYASLASAPFEAGNEVMITAWRSGEGALSAFGPFAFPVSVLMVVTVFVILIWGVSRFVR